MNCDYCKFITAFIDNELPSDQRSVLENHLKTCPSCAREVETFRRLGGLFDDLPEEMPSPAFVRTTVNRAAQLPQRLFWNNLLLNPTISFVKSAVVFVFAPDGSSSAGRKNLSSRGYLRTFDDSPPGSFADVYLTVIQGGSN